MSRSRSLVCSIATRTSIHCQRRISPAVRQTLRLCLEKDARERVADIRDVRLSLRGAFETTSPQMAEAAAVSRSVWRQALPFAATAIGAVLISGLTVWVGMRPEPQPVNRFDYDLPDGPRVQKRGPTCHRALPERASFHLQYDTRYLPAHNGRTRSAINSRDRRRVARIHSSRRIASRSPTIPLPTPRSNASLSAVVHPL